MDKMMPNFKSPPENFQYILFDLVRPNENKNRFYHLSWQASLIDKKAIIRTYGRKGQWQKVQVTSYETLEEAWPTIRRLIPLRLKRGYRIVEPTEWATVHPKVDQ